MEILQQLHKIVLCLCGLECSGVSTAMMAMNSRNSTLYLEKESKII